MAKILKKSKIQDLPELYNSMLLATGWVICRDVCHPSFPPKEVTALPMYVQGFCRSYVHLRKPEFKENILITMNKVPKTKKSQQRVLLKCTRKIIALFCMLARYGKSPKTKSLPKENGISSGWE